MDNAPSLPTHLADAAEQRPTTPRIPKSYRETAPATSDFRNQTLAAHMIVLDFRNPDKKG